VLRTITAIVARQRDDGSWINGAERWEESQPDLATIYAVLALTAVFFAALLALPIFTVSDGYWIH